MYNASDDDGSKRSQFAIGKKVLNSSGPLNIPTIYEREKTFELNENITTNKNKNVRKELEFKWKMRMIKREKKRKEKKKKGKR